MSDPLTYVDFSCHLRLSPWHLRRTWLNLGSHPMRLSHSCTKFNPFIGIKVSYLLFPSKDLTTHYELRSSLSIVQVRSFYQQYIHLIRIIAVAGYDLILSFPTEITWVWKRKLAAGMVLYLSLRYCTIIFFVIETLGGILVIRSLIVSAEPQHMISYLTINTGVRLHRA